MGPHGHLNQKCSELVRFSPTLKVKNKGTTLSRLKTPPDVRKTSRGVLSNLELPGEDGVEAREPNLISAFLQNVVPFLLSAGW